MKDLELFKQGKVLYHIPTKKHFETLMKLIKENDIESLDIDWDFHKEETVLRYADEWKCVRYDCRDFYQNDINYKDTPIVEFNPFTLKDKITANTVVKLRNGYICCMMVREKGLNLHRKSNIGRCGGVINISEYSDDLTTKYSEYDILAFAQYRNQSEAIGIILNDITPKWDWVRPVSPLELTMDDIKTKFNCQEQGFVITDNKSTVDNDVPWL